MQPPSARMICRASVLPPASIVRCDSRPTQPFSKSFVRASLNDHAVVLEARASRRRRGGASRGPSTKKGWVRPAPRSRAALRSPAPGSSRSKPSWKLRPSESPVASRTAVRESSVGLRWTPLWEASVGLALQQLSLLAIAFGPAVNADFRLRGNSQRSEKWQTTRRTQAGMIARASMSTKIRIEKLGPQVCGVHGRPQGSGEGGGLSCTPGGATPDRAKEIAPGKLMRALTPAPSRMSMRRRRRTWHGWRIPRPAAWPILRPAGAHKELRRAQTIGLVARLEEGPRH